MLNILFAIIGLLVGIGINVLADVLPRRQRPSGVRCRKCGHAYGPPHWLGLGRKLWGGGQCPQCGLPTRWRVIGVEVGTAVLFAALPSFIPDRVTLVVNTFYTAAFILIIVIDLEHRLILNVTTFPLTALGLLLSFIVDDNSFLSAIVGAVVGFLLFFLVYQLGQAMFGPGALGYGDVKLAMAMGAMLGFHRILFALVIAILLGGVVSAILLLTRRFHRTSYLPYGQYLALAGIAMLIWGVQIAEWYAQ